MYNLQQRLSRCLSLGVVLTALSFFMGGVRYPYDDNIFLPIWLQLVRNFGAYFAVSFVVLSLADWLVQHTKIGNSQ